MNRRQFIKASVPVVAIPAIAITCKYEDDEKGPERESSKTSEGWKRWDYRVYCYEREQGEWLFSENTRGSFAHQREYMTFDEENDLTWNGYAGWMDGGKLHFATFDDATNFVDTHVRAKEDINLIDSIYDIYFISRNTVKDQYSVEDVVEEREIKVAHYWFNGDTGRTITWEQDGFNHKTGDGLTDWNKVESG
jgi:hypothetical protein